MAKICIKCGYWTKNERTNICPCCLSQLVSGEKSIEEGRREADEGAPQKENNVKEGKSLLKAVTPYLAGNIAILCIILYITLFPDSFWNLPIWNQIESVTSMSLEDDGEVSTDSQGNTILEDFVVPDVEVQPQYVLASESETYWRVVTQGDMLNLRTGPGIEYAILDAIPNGETVIGCGYSHDAPSNWFVVRYNERYGWACADYLQALG